MITKRLQFIGQLLLLTLLLLTLPLFNGGFAQAADIQVKIDRQLIEANQTFTLQFESSDDIDAEPDFSPLEKDFRIISQSSGSNISIINGEYQKSRQWSLTLIALRDGKLTIPSIQFGKDKSRAYQIEVQPVKASEPGSQADFISELEVSHEQLVVQGELVVTQRLLSSRNITAYEFSPLQTSGVEVATEPLGDVKQYQTRRGNKAYLVLEQRHAIYPQAAGELTIEPSLASARIALNSGSGFDPFRSNTQTVRRTSPARNIQVAPVASGFSGRHWLPAREVQLVEEFPDGDSFKVGEPITRTLSLLVNGQMASQLPEFELPEIKDLKQYPDKPLLNNSKSDSGIIGVQQIKVALIPGKAGTYTLPVMEIPWWNTQNGKMEIARLDARSFKVTPAGATPGTDKDSAPKIISTPADNAPPVSPAVTDESAEPANADQTANTSADNTQSSTLWKLLSLLLALGWLATLVFFMRRKTATTTSHNNQPAQPSSVAAARRQLKSACDSANPQKIKNALLQWGNALFTDQALHSLGQLASRIASQPNSSELSQRLNQLNECLYNNSSADWRCDNLLTLCQAFEQTQTTKTSSEHEPQLEDLYK
ncbi:MAG TPA: BatD family protein [Gammaproteobacteria bacterium]